MGRNKSPRKRRRAKAKARSRSLVVEGMTTRVTSMPLFSKVRRRKQRKQRKSRRHQGVLRIVKRRNPFPRQWMTMTTTNRPANNEVVSCVLVYHSMSSLKRRKRKTRTEASAAIRYRRHNGARAPASAADPCPHQLETKVTIPAHRCQRTRNCCPHHRYSKEPSR